MLGFVNLSVLYCYSVYAEKKYPGGFFHPVPTVRPGAEGGPIVNVQKKLIYSLLVSTGIDIVIFITALVVGILGLTALSSSISAAAAYFCLSISSLNFFLWAGFGVFVYVKRSRIN